MLMLLSCATATHAADEAAVREMIFKEVDGTQLRLMIHEPPASTEPRAAIVLFYGGGWNNGDLEQFTPHAKHFASRGMVAIRAEYRVRKRHNTSPFEAMADARDAIRWVRAHAEELKIDPQRIAAGGGSAGGHVALCSAVIAGDEQAQVSCIPDALVLFNPVVDTSKGGGFGVGRTERLRERFGGRELEASPLHHVREATPPTLIMHGDADTTVRIEQIRRFQKRMQETGNVCEVIEYPGREHGFFNHGRGGGKDHQATLQAADDFLVRQGFLPEPK
jgi:acetyl esterase